MTDPADPCQDALWTNVHLATLTADADDYGETHDDAIAVKNSRIAWPGYRADLPISTRAARGHDGGGAWLTPDLINCHMHLVRAGSRSNEFEARPNGVSYEEIAHAGDGTLSTIRTTRAVNEDVLAEAGLPCLNALRAEGVTIVEIKSGYGLNLETERRMLRVARRFGQSLPMHVRTIFLGAHAMSPKFTGRADDYIDHLYADVLPAFTAEGLVDAVDTLYEAIGFTPTQTARMLNAAQRRGLPAKLHAEQLLDQGGAALMVRYGGLSADHPKCLTEADIAAMAQADTIAMLLPGAFYCLCETRLPPMATLRVAGMPTAVSTDCNPSTSPISSLLLAMSMACTLSRLTPLGALTDATHHAAAALGLSGACDVLAPSYVADFVPWRINRPTDLTYAIRLNSCAGVVKSGVVAA